MTDEESLRELVRRNGLEEAPRARTMHTYEVVVGIGRDHHCYITFTDAEDVSALMAETTE